MQAKIIIEETDNKQSFLFNRKQSQHDLVKRYMNNPVIHLHFLEPYRVLDYLEDAPEKKERGLAFALWKQQKDKDVFRCLITGTLLRSATIRSAEEILSITNGKVNGFDGKCCDGRFNSGNTRHSRKRPTFKWIDEEGCGKCPYCVLLGRGIGENKKVEGLKNIFRFHNLELAGKRDFPENYLKKIATYRILNRIDPHTGKAFDYFRVWEVEDESFWHFKGKIEINDQWFKEKGIDHKLKEASIRLLTDSLKFIDRLCGAMCVIEIKESENNTEVKAPHKGNETNTGQNEVDAIAEETALEITTIFEKTSSIDKLRTVADAIRALRHKGRMYINQLPEGKEGEHFIWDKNTTIKKYEIFLKNLLVGYQIKTGGRLVRLLADVFTGITKKKQVVLWCEREFLETPSTMASRLKQARLYILKAEIR